MSIKAIIILTSLSALLMLNKICANEITLLDSLAVELKKCEEKNRAAILNEISYGLIKVYLTNPDTLEKSLKFADEALEISTELGQSNEMVKSHLNIGRVYFYTNQHEKASVQFRKALQIAEKDSDNVLIAECYKALGGLYSFWSNLNKAKEYYVKALEIVGNSDDYELIASILNNAGNIYDKEGDYQSALSYYLRALSTYEKDQNLRGQIYALNNIGFTYKNLSQEEKAIQYMDKALKLNISISDKQGEAALLTNIGDVYFDQGDFPMAFEYTLASQKIAEEENLTEFLIANYLRLANIAYELLDFQEAYQYRVKYATLKDSIFDTEKLKLITEMESKFESLKKEQEIATLKEQKKFQSKLNYLFITVALLAVFLVILIINRHFIKVRLHREELRKIGVELDSKHRELTSSSIHMENKNRILHEINSKLSDIQDLGTNEIHSGIKSVISIIKENTSLDEDWENLKLHFEKVHPDFFAKLTAICSDLSHNDLKHCAYIRYNLSTKEIARLLNIGARSVQTSRYRLKKKLNIDSDVRDFLLKL